MRWEDKRNFALLTDFYELTMMYGYFCTGKTEEIATFDLFFRPFEESAFCICAGLEQAIDYINNIRFGEQELQYLRNTKSFDEQFLQYLANFKFTGTIRAVEEGNIVFPGEPILTVTAPIMQAQLLETALLNIINFQTLIATKARRVCHVAHPNTVLEFGLRRAQGPDAGVFGARAAIIGGCSSTSNVLSAQLFGFDAKGTHAHSWVMSFDSEYEALLTYAKIYPDNCLLLVDTYDTLKSGIPNAIKVFKWLIEQGHQPVGIRLDSGDLAYLSKQARKMLDDNGLQQCKIFASSDIDEYVITALKEQGAKIDIYGVGTKMITSHNNPSLGGVYKISDICVDGVHHPKMKISDNVIKMTNPGKKSVYRLFDKDTNKAIADVITLQHEVIDDTQPLTITHPVERYKTTVVDNFYAKPMLCDIFVDGKLVYDIPTVATIASRTQQNLDTLWEEYKRINKPQIYKVDLSDELYQLKCKLILEGKKNGKV